MIGRIKSGLETHCKHAEVYENFMQRKYNLPVLPPEKLKVITQHWNYCTDQDYSSCSKPEMGLIYIEILDLIFQMQKELNKDKKLNELQIVQENLYYRIKLHDEYIEYCPNITCDGHHRGYLFCRIGDDRYVVLEYVHEHS